jgi:hypothetical protein
MLTFSVCRANSAELLALHDGFADSSFSESQPIFDLVPFVVGIAKPISSVTTRTLYGQLVFEGVGYNGFAILNFVRVADIVSATAQKQRGTPQSAYVLP